MGERFGRGLAARWRRTWNWGNAIAALMAAVVYLFASEMLEREVGDKSAFVVKIVVVGLLAVLLVVRWVRNDPSADHEDERSS